MFPDEFCTHFSLLNRILIPFPPQNSEQFFSLRSASTLQILGDTSHIPLESPFGTVLCLWVFIASAHKPCPLCLNSPKCAFSREKGMGVAESQVGHTRRSRGGFRERS